MTAAALTPEQTEDLRGYVNQLRGERERDLARILADALSGRDLSSTDDVTLHVHADYLDRTGRRERSEAITTLLGWQ